MNANYTGKTSIRVAITISFCCAIAVLSIYGKERYTQLRAERLVAAFRSFRPGQTSEIDVTKQLMQFNKELNHQWMQQTNPSRREVDYFFENRLLRSLHLAPHKYIYLNLSIRDGKLVDKHFMFAEESRSAAVIDEAIRPYGFTVILKPAEHRRVEEVKYGLDMQKASVRDDESESKQQLDKDWTFDLNCFSRIGSCRDPRHILIGAFSN